MKKSKFKKFLATSTMGIMALSMPFALTGCDKNSDINVRIEGEYLQWQVEGEKSWTNLLTIDEILDAIGNDIKGEPGKQGIDGKQVEFDATSTHIVWKYVGDTTWKNLIAFSDLEKQDDVIDVEELKQRGFELFQSKLNNMNNDCKVTYEYADKYIVESFKKFGTLEWISNESAETITINTSVTYDYSGKSKLPDSDEWIKCYNFYGYVEKTGNFVPHKQISCLYEYQQDIQEYKDLGGGRTFLHDISSERFNYASYLKYFTVDDVIDCRFNDDGDCVISFNYYSDTYNSSKPYLESDYIYEFNINQNGEIVKCYVYEKDFLNNNQIGDLFCKISYERGKSLITREILEGLLEKEKQNNSEITCWFDYFNFTQSED